MLIFIGWDWILYDRNGSRQTALDARIGARA